jgi:Lar family restriction alleviation protein
MTKCTVPPPGWQCSRNAGHDGPCAASPPTERVVVKPCPHCGGTDTACAIVDEDNGRYWVECFCGARGPVTEALKDARPEWNRRAAPEPASVKDFIRSDPATRERIGEDVARKAFARQDLMKYAMAAGDAIVRASGKCPHCGKGVSPEPGAGQPPKEYILQRKSDLYDCCHFPAHGWNLIVVPQQPETKSVVAPRCGYCGDRGEIQIAPGMAWVKCSRCLTPNGGPKP